MTGARTRHFDGRTVTDDEAYEAELYRRIGKLTPQDRRDVLALVRKLQEPATASVQSAAISLTLSGAPQQDFPPA